MKILLSIIAVGLLCACSRGNDGGDFVWIGCHVIHTNPANCNPGSDKCKVYAFDVAGDRYIGERIFFKQLRKGQDRYEPVGSIKTARPCKDDE